MTTRINMTTLRVAILFLMWALTALCAEANLPMMVFLFGGMTLGFAVRTLRIMAERAAADAKK